MFGKRLSKKFSRWVRKGGPSLWQRAPALFSYLLASRDPLRALLYALHRVSDTLVFVQVGSNDADEGDPLVPFVHTRQWTGVMIEPVRFVFERLVRKHGHDPTLAFENVAIAPQPGAQPFFYVPASADPLPDWYDQLGSFSLETILKHEANIPRLRERIVTTQVACVTFDAICIRHQLDAIDLIHIDTEGFDYEVLRLINFHTLQPTVVIYEHKHLNPADRLNATDLLQDVGFVTTIVGDDTLCVRQQALLQEKVLRHTWERITAA